MRESGDTCLQLRSVRDMCAAAEVVVDALNLNHTHRAHVVRGQATCVRAETAELRVRRVLEAEAQEQQDMSSDSEQTHSQTQLTRSGSESHVSYYSYGY